MLCIISRRFASIFEQVLISQSYSALAPQSHRAIFRLGRNVDHAERFAS